MLLVTVPQLVIGRNSCKQKGKFSSNIDRNLKCLSNTSDKVVYPQTSIQQVTRGIQVLKDSKNLFKQY